METQQNSFSYLGMNSIFTCGSAFSWSKCRQVLQFSGAHFVPQTANSQTNLRLTVLWPPAPKHITVYWCVNTKSFLLLTYCIFVLGIYFWNAMLLLLKLIHKTSEKIGKFCKKDNVTFSQSTSLPPPSVGLGVLQFYEWLLPAILTCQPQSGSTLNSQIELSHVKTNSWLLPTTSIDVNL